MKNLLNYLNYSFMYPDIDKDQMLKHFDVEEKQKSETDKNLGYITSAIVMVANVRYVNSYKNNDFQQ